MAPTVSKLAKNFGSVKRVAPPPPGKSRGAPKAPALAPLFQHLTPHNGNEPSFLTSNTHSVDLCSKYGFITPAARSDNILSASDKIFNGSLQNRIDEENVVTNSNGNGERIYFGMPSKTKNKEQHKKLSLAQIQEDSANLSSRNKYDDRTENDIFYRKNKSFDSPRDENLKNSDSYLPTYKICPKNDYFKSEENSLEVDSLQRLSVATSYSNIRLRSSNQNKQDNCKNRALDNQSDDETLDHLKSNRLVKSAVKAIENENETTRSIFPKKSNFQSINERVQEDQRKRERGNTENNRKYSPGETSISLIISFLCILLQKTFIT